MSARLALEGLRLDIDGVRVLDGISFAMAPGERLALVGPDGAGKTVLSRLVMGVLPRRARLRGRVLHAGIDLFGRRVRGQTFDVHADAAGLAAPDLIFAPHGPLAGPLLAIAPRAPVADWIAAITPAETPPPRRAADADPGALAELLVRAVAARGASLIVADDPAEGLETAARLRLAHVLNTALSESGAALFLVTRDAAFAALVCSRLAFLDGGRIVEEGPSGKLLARPQSPIARAYVQALAPAVAEPEPGAPQGGLALAVEGLRLPGRRRARLALQAPVGRILAVVGPRGSGKTDLAEAIRALKPPRGSALRVGGVDIATAGRAIRESLARRIVWLDAQDRAAPAARSIADAIEAAAYEAARRPDVEQPASRARLILRQIGFTPEEAARPPAALSRFGSRVTALGAAIARMPMLLIADDPVHDLDPPSASSFLAMLREAQRRMGFAVIYLTRDIAQAARLADEIAILDEGAVVEQAAAARLLEAPQHRATQALIRDAEMLLARPLEGGEAG